jgi:hypothetical protein
MAEMRVADRAWRPVESLMTFRPLNIVESRLLRGWGQLAAGLALCLAIAGVAVAAPPATGGFDKPIPNSRFPTYVKFAADPGNDNVFVGQANVVGVPAPTEGPWFVAGFFKPEDFDNFGALVSWGCQDDRGAGLASVILTGKGDGYQLTSFQWSDADFGESGYGGLAPAPMEWANGRQGYLLGQWSHVAFVQTDHTRSVMVLDGVTGAPQSKPIAWPKPRRGDNPMMLTFGSYFFGHSGQPLPPAGSYTPGIHHNLNGGLRDWVVVLGTPAPGELERHRNGEDPLAIWGKDRVWGYWHFTTDPHVAPHMEPDVSGHGRNLSYYDGGTNAAHQLPVLVTPTAPAQPTPNVTH